MNKFPNLTPFKTWLPVVAVCMLAVLLRWPSLEQPIDNDGGARAYHARLILAGEPLYSSHHTGHHLPGIYYTYAAAMALFGDSNWSIKFFLILWTVPTIYVFYRLGWLLTDRRVALLGAVFYAVLSVHIRLWGLTAETELFANLPRITAVFILIYLLQKDAPAWQFVVVGLLGAMTFLYKLIYISPLAIAGTVLWVQFWRHGNAPGAWGRMVRRMVWVGIGFLAGLLPVILYFAVLNLLPRLWLVFQLGSTYGAASDVVPDALPIFGQWLLYPLLPLFGLGFNNAALLILGLAGFVLILIRPSYRSSPLLYLALWFIFSFFEAAVNLELFTHYYLLIVPALTLLAAWFLLKFFRDIKAYKRLAPSLLAILLLLVFGLSVGQNYPYYYHYARYKLGQETLAESVSNGWPGFGARLARAVSLAAYVSANTQPEDKIYYWSEDVQLYYLADRRNPIDTIWPIDVEATGSYQRLFSSPTRYIIIDLNREPAAPAWLTEELARTYVLEATFDEQEIYRRVE